MDIFKFNTQTTCYCGIDCVKENTNLFKNYGKKAVIITSIFCTGYKNYALEDIKSVFNELNINYIILNGVYENPPVDSIVNLTKECFDFKPDFIVAIGGGSSIDSAKAVSLLMSHPGEDPYSIFYKGGSPSQSNKTESDLPVLAIPTTAGTGAEVTGFAVLTRSDTNTKLCMYPVVFCEVAFLDPKYIKESPDSLLHSGTMDALAHGVETYLHNDSNIINRSVAEIGFSLFAKYKEHLLYGHTHLTDEDFQNMLIASYMMGLAFMQSSTTIPHGMSYPLSHTKHVHHGLACGLILGEYLKGFKNQSLVMPIIKACGFESTDEFAQYTDAITEKHMKAQITDDDIEEWTDEFMKLTFRINSNPEPLQRSDIKQLYKNSLKKYIEK